MSSKFEIYFVRQDIAPPLLVCRLFRWCSTLSFCHHQMFQICKEILLVWLPSSHLLLISRYFLVWALLTWSRSNWSANLSVYLNAVTPSIPRRYVLCTFFMIMILSSSDFVSSYLLRKYCSHFSSLNNHSYLTSLSLVCPKYLSSWNSMLFWFSFKSAFFDPFSDFFDFCFDAISELSTWTSLF